MAAPSDTVSHLTSFGSMTLSCILLFRYLDTSGVAVMDLLEGPCRRQHGKPDILRQAHLLEESHGVLYFKNLSLTLGDRSAKSSSNLNPDFLCGTEGRPLRSFKFSKRHISDLRVFLNINSFIEER